MKRIVEFIGISMLTIMAAPPAYPESLLDAYRIALQEDPGIRKAQAARLAIRESKNQAVATLLPQVTASTSYEWEDIDDDSTRPQPPFGQADFVEKLNQETFRWGLELRQTLFRWDEWVRVKQADKQRLKADIDYRSAELDLLIRVADAYFLILSEQATLESTQAARAAIEVQLREARESNEVGLTPLTDVQEAEASLDQATAAEIRAKRNLSNARERLREITNRYPERLAKPRAELPLVGPDPEAVEAWVKIALEQNYDLQSAQLGADIARDNVRISRAGYLPSIELVGTYADSDLNGDRNIDWRFTEFPEFSNDLGPIESNRDESSIAVQLSIPLFTGGNTSSRTRESRYQYAEAREQLEIVTRTVARQTRDAYENVISDIAEVQARQRALKSAEVALQATEAGYEAATRTSIDVLDSRRRLFDAQTNYARSRHTYIVNALVLKQAAGTLAAPDIEVVNGWLQEQEPGATE